MATILGPQGEPIEVNDDESEPGQASPADTERLCGFGPQGERLYKRVPADSK